MANCIFPGCNSVLSYNSISGVCRTHNHAADHCCCSRCRSKAELAGNPRGPYKPKQTKPVGVPKQTRTLQNRPPSRLYASTAEIAGTKIVVVGHQASTNVGAMAMSVRLPRDPWE